MFSNAWTRCGGLFFYCQDHFCGWYTLTELLTARFFALYPVLVLRIPESIDLGLTKDFYLVLTAATLSIGINIEILARILSLHYSISNSIATGRVDDRFGFFLVLTAATLSIGINIEILARILSTTRSPTQ